VWSKSLPEGRNNLARELFASTDSTSVRRLTLCFLFIILALLVGNVVLLWQFHLARAQADRLSGVDQELITILQAQTSLMTFL